MIKMHNIYPCKNALADTLAVYQDGGAVVYLKTISNHIHEDLTALSQKVLKDIEE